MFSRRPRNSSDNLEPTLHWTELSLDLDYNFYYYNLATIIVWGIIPTILLVYFNLMIYIGIKSPNSILQRELTKQKRFKQEKKLATVMIGIVVVFLLCHSLRNFACCYCFSLVEQVQNCYKQNESYKGGGITFLPMPKWFEITWILNEWLLVVNSSVNMIIYCCLNSKFRKHVFAVVKQVSGKRRTYYLAKVNEAHKENENLSDVAL